MSRIRIAALACAAVISASLVLSGAVSVMAQPAPAGPNPAPVLGHWGTAIPAPGATALTNVTTWINATSCAPGGLCALVGEYSNDTLGDGQAFVATAHNGTWGKALALPGTAGVTTNGGHSEVSAVSCATAYCVAGGGLATGLDNGRAFVSVYKRGIWRQPTIIPGLEDSLSEVMAVSCPAPGNCTAGGWYQQPTRLIQAFVADEVNGTWGHFQDLGVLDQLNAGGSAQVDSMSCGSPGDCVGSGFFLDDQGNQQAFFGHEVAGRWENVQTNPSVLGPSNALAESCVASNACAVVGTSQDNNGHAQAFAFPVDDGGEQLATFIPGITSLNAGGNAWATAVSCPSAGNCAAGGAIITSGHLQALVAAEKS